MISFSPGVKLVEGMPPGYDLDLDYRICCTNEYFEENDFEVEVIDECAKIEEEVVKLYNLVDALKESKRIGHLV